MTEWISVKDSLPDHAYRVLITDGIRVVLGEYDLDFWCGESRYLDDNIGVLFWMPLPDLPK